MKRGQKGFTLIELLIVVAILGILAVVVAPNLIGFMGTGKVAAANTEVANLKTAALAYYADNDAVFPDSTDDLYPEYLDRLPTQVYTIDDEYGKPIPSDPDDWDGSGALHWEGEQWVKD